MPEMTVNAAPEQLAPVMDFVNKRLTALGCSNKVRFDVYVVVNEIFCNIIRYAYGPETGTVTVRVETEEDPPALTMTFMDRGVPFDPLAKEMPDTTALPAWKRPVGGLGLFMVRRLVDEIAYVRRDGQNVLTLRKRV